jgi:hypothetical protein
MNRANACARQHRVNTFYGERHVDNYTVAFFNARTFQSVSDLTDAAEQAVVCYHDFLSAFRCPNQRDLIAPMAFNISIERVDCNVCFSAQKPLVMRRLKL